MASPVRKLVVLEDREALAQQARAEWIRASPRTAGLAGGRTPRRTYELLSDAKLDWGSVTVCPTDERHVPPDHPSSNYRMISETLLSKVDARSLRVDTSLPPRESAARFEEELAELLPFDLVLLGLGADGHTASLFPGSADSARVDRLAIATRSPESGMPRVTLTLAALNTAQNALFLVAGKEKTEALGRLMRGDPIPAGRVRPREKVVVLADEEAAAALPAGIPR